MNTQTQNTQTASHTPGPWSHTPMQDTIWANDGETKIATIADLPWITLSSGRRTSDSATEQANARLVAAAPELLERLGIVTRTAFELVNLAGGKSAINQKTFNLAMEIIEASRASILKAGGRV